MTRSTSEAGAFGRIAALTSAFYQWEQRGRGWHVWPYSVELEPPFVPFAAGAPLQPLSDDARKPTLLGGWFTNLFGRQNQPALPVNSADEPEEPEPDPAPRYKTSEIHLALAPDVKVSADLAEHFLLALTSARHPVGFEIIATEESIIVELACAESDAPHVRDQARAYFPDAVVAESSGTLEDAWRQGRGPSVIVDFGLSQEFMRPLKVFSRFDADPLVGVMGALADLAAGEVAILQVLFQATRAPWQSSILHSIQTFDGDPFFLDAPELVSLAKQKLNRPLFAAVIRVAAKSPEPGRPWQIAKRLGGTLAQLADPSSNELIALDNEDYPNDVHETDVLLRQSHRSGSLLNTEELVSLVHPPSTVVRAPKLARGNRRTKAAPKELWRQELVLGANSYGGVTNRVGLKAEQRLRHMHVVGASGTGKSTLLLHFLVQDMAAGRGCALIDPHGDLIDQVLGRVPDNRVNDVILVDPADVEHPIGFNILSAHSDLEKTLLASDLVSVFRRLSTSWGDQMTSVLSNAVLAFLESSRGGTLADLRRFLVEAEFRKAFLETVADREVIYYWQKEFPLLAGRPQAPLLTRLDTFLRPRLVRGMVAQSANRLDFASIMNEGKILLVKLAQGAIGEENAALLGTLFVAKIHQLALGRQAIAESDRRPFYVYMDEFQHFVTPSMATLLTGARKYRVGLILAHQELRQLWNQDRDVAGAILSNAATRICFRVGDDDAKKLEDGYTSFTARDLQNLGVGQAVCRVDRADWDFSLTTEPLPHLDAALGQARRDEVVRLSRERYGSVAQVPEEPPASSGSAESPTPPSPIERPRREPQRRKQEPLPNLPEMPTPALGRGGAQHKYLQELIRRWADAHGWRATIEQQILDGLGSVDVALEREDRRVACEISVSSTTDYEIGNVRKCLAAGYTHVVSVVVERRTLEKIRKAVALGIESADAERVHVLEPQDLFTLLDEFTPAPSTTERTARGYKVKVTRGAAGGRDQAARSVVQTVGRALQRLRRGG